MLRKQIFILILSVLLISVCFPAAAETSPSPMQKLTLEDCLKLGFAHSQTLQTAAKNTQVAQESVRQAESALGLTVGYSVNRVESDSAYDTASLSLNFPAFNLIKLRNNLKVAQIQLESARENERQAKLEVTYEIKNAVYDLWLKEQKLAVAQSSYDNLGQHYQIIKKYCEVGKKPEYELLEAEVSWKEQKAEVTSALSDVDLAKLDLATIIGIDQDQDFQIVYDSAVQQLPEKYQVALKTLLEKAKQQRPDLRQAAAEVQIAELNVAIAKSGNYPTLSLSGSQNDLNNQFQLTLGVSGTLYDNKLNASKVKAMEQKVEIAKLNETKTSDAMRQSVQKLYQSIQVDLENSLAYQANIDLRKEDLRLTEIRYNAGMSTIMDVKDRQLALDKSCNNYYQAVASYITHLAQLDMEVGNEI